MTLDIEIKMDEILQLTKEKQMIKSENHEEIGKYIFEKEQLVIEQKEALKKHIEAKEKLEDDHASVVLKLSSDREAEVSKLSQAVLLVQEQLQGREKVCRDLEKKVNVGRQG